MSSSSSDEGVVDSADSDTPAYVPPEQKKKEEQLKQADAAAAAQKKEEQTPADLEVEAEVEEEEDQTLTPDKSPLQSGFKEEIKGESHDVTPEKLTKEEEKAKMMEEKARAEAREAAKQTRKKGAAEQEEEEKKSSSSSSDDDSSDDKKEKGEVDEEGLPLASPRKLAAMESGQIVLQFLRADGLKKGNYYAQAKLLSPKKQTLHETGVIKKTEAPDWSAEGPPRIYNVKDAEQSVLKLQVMHKSFVGALDSVYGEVIISVSDMAPGVPYTRWYPLDVKEKDKEKKKGKKGKELGRVQINLMFFNINQRFFQTEFTHPLHTLIRKKYEDGIVHLLEKEGYESDIQDPEGNTALHLACEFDLPGVVNLLVTKGFTFETANNKDQLPMHLAAANSAKSVEILLKKGAECSTKDSEGMYPLHLAAQGNNGEAVSLLVKIGKADVNIKSDEGDTPLCLAVVHNSHKAVRHLGKHGADPFITGAGGKAPVDYFFAKKEKLGGGGDVMVADGAERQVSSETKEAMLKAYDALDPREFLMRKKGFTAKHMMKGSCVSHAFSSKTQQWTVSCTEKTKLQAIVFLEESTGLQNEQISFVVTKRDSLTVYRHPSTVQNVVAYGEEDPIEIELEPEVYYTFVPYTRHPDIKGDYQFALYTPEGSKLEVLELMEWPYGDQLASEWSAPDTAGGAQPNETWEKNPYFALRVNRKRKDVHLAILLQQPRVMTDMIPFQVVPYASYIGFYVYEGDSNVSKVCESGPTWLNAREVWTYLTIDGTKTPKLRIIPATYKPGEEKKFTLKVMCNHKCRINALTADGKDIERTATTKKKKKKKKATTTTTTTP